MTQQAIRTEIDGLISSGNELEASRLLNNLWNSSPGVATAEFVVTHYESLRSSLPFLPYRLAILRSCTLEPVVPLLRAGAFTYGIDLEVHLGGFNAYAEEITDPGSSLYHFAPQACLLAVDIRDVAPELWFEYARLNSAERCSAVERVAEVYSTYVSAFRKHSAASLIVHSMDFPSFPSQGILASQSGSSQFGYIEEINCRLARLREEYRGVYLLDYGTLASRHGRLSWHDHRSWSNFRMPMGAGHVKDLAQEWLRYIVPLVGRSAKVLVTDLDNTLWGGVIGEDGLNGIQLGTKHPGPAFLEVQRALLDIRERGILLAVCSKNNLADAMEVFEQHRGMSLRAKHFAAMRINWKDKPENLRDIAAELNVGEETIAFLDDSPMERELVRKAIPRAIVIDLPPDPEGFAKALRNCCALERVVLLEEDQNRAAYYDGQRLREGLKQGASSRQAFYISLRQCVEISPLTPSTLSRMAQLTQKTNQFNLTTRRYTEQEIDHLARQPGWRIFSMRVVDRFGDNGLTGIAIVHIENAICEIESFLLSCRVIGRTVETAFLAFLVKHARAQGCREMRGWFLPTVKNAPAREFYSQHGFCVGEQSQTGSLWVLDLQKSTVVSPEWIQVIEPEKQEATQDV